MQYLNRQNSTKLAFMQQIYNKFPFTIVFLSGFRSDMQGTKAVFLSEYCEKKSYDFVRFDYSGHGESEGDFDDLCLSDWVNDAIDVIRHASPDKPCLIIGSSMGGWIGLRLLKTMPEKAIGFIGLAAAPDFTKGMIDALTADNKRELSEKGYYECPCDYDPRPYRISGKLLDDGKKHYVFDKPFVCNAPLYFIQGTLDKDVPYQTALHLMNHCESDTIHVELIKNGDHRLSTAADLRTLEKAVDYVVSLTRNTGFS